MFLHSGYAHKRYVPRGLTLRKGLIIILLLSRRQRPNFECYTKLFTLIGRLNTCRIIELQYSLLYFNRNTNLKIVQTFDETRQSTLTPADVYQTMFRVKMPSRVHDEENDIVKVNFRSPGGDECAVSLSKGYFRKVFKLLY